MIWKLADAKNKFSEVFRLALSEGPQRIERRGNAAVLVSAEEFERLRGEKPDLIEYLSNGPDLSELDLTRDRSPMRDIEL